MRTPTIDKLAQKLYEKDPAQAVTFLTDYCNTNANSVINAWWKLGNDLLVKYNKLWVYDTKARRMRRLQYPDWFLRLLVKYDKLVPQEPPKKK